MKKITTLIVMAMLCLNFYASAQKKGICIQESISKCKWGFSGYKSGFTSYSKITPSGFGKWRRLIIYNQTLPEMFAVALRTSGLIIDVKNPEKFAIRYCYELNAPPELADDIFVIMHQHLLYEFPEYTASIIYKNDKSYVLINDKDEGILLQTAKNTTY